jgi:hypothetical protein
MEFGDNIFLSNNNNNNYNNCNISHHTNSNNNSNNDINTNFIFTTTNEPLPRYSKSKYIRKRKLDESPKQRGGNRRKRSHETMRIDSYHGGDRGFILRFQNAGTQERETRYGKRGALRERNWFGISSVFQMEAAANKIAEDIERIIATEFKPI